MYINVSCKYIFTLYVYMYIYVYYIMYTCTYIYMHIYMIYLHKMGEKTGSYLASKYQILF